MTELDQPKPGPMLAPAPGPVQVNERNGIWVVTEDGAFLGDYRDAETARAAAAHARGPGASGGPDPWQRPDPEPPA